MLRDGSGRAVALGERLGRGGEGEVFAVEGAPTLVAKVLDARHRAGKAAKLQAMLARPPAGANDLVEGLPVLTWPRGLLLDGRDLVGYTMARVRPTDFVPLHQVTSAARRHGLGGGALSWDKLVLLGLRLAHVVTTLHRFGYAVGDLNDRNVLVSRRLTPLLMDTDSFQVPDGRRVHPCTVGDALVWPPELLDVDLARRPVDRTASDDYALAALLFQLFMAGARPYQSRGSAVAGLETLQAKTRAGHYPWDRPRRGVLEPPAGAPSYAGLPKAVRAAFERAFVAGHRKPNKRPTAQDWVSVLSAVRAAGYQTCRREARHVFGANEAGCPWCADPNDPFTPRKAIVRVTPKVRRQTPVARVRPKAAPQLMLAPIVARPPLSPSPPMRRPRASPPRPAAKPQKTRQTPKRRGRSGSAAACRSTRNRWPAKARWMAALTSALVVAWWVTS